MIFTMSVYADQSDANCPQDGNTQISVLAVCKQATADNFSDALPNAKKNDVFLAYTYAMAPEQNQRLQGIQQQEKESLGLLKGFDKSNTDVYRYLESIAADPPKYPAPHAIQYALDFDKKLSTQTKNMNGMKLGGDYECGIVGNSDCKQAFGDLVDLMSPSDGFYTVLSLPRVWKELGTDERYVKPLASLALLLEKRVELAKAGKLTDSGDLFYDVQKQFLASGLPAAQANAMTWKFLALYSTRGASAMPLYLAADNVNKSVFISTALVASMISYLDGYSLKAKSAKIYSLPKMVTTSCDYTRPYHFWLAAYLAHELQKKGYSKAATFKAVHLSETLYEQFSTTYTKKSPDKVIASSLHNFYNVETQKNIAFNDAGAFFELEPNQQVNLDDSIRTMYSSAKDAPLSSLGSLLGGVSDALKQYTSYDLGIITRWDSMIAPDTAFEQLSNKLN
jgi:hypothetical protein